MNNENNTQSDALAAMLVQQSLSSDPLRYARILQAIKSNTVEKMRESLPDMEKNLHSLEDKAKMVKMAKDRVLGSGYARRKKNAQDDIYGGLSRSSDLGNKVTALELAEMQISFATELQKRLYESTVLICNANIVSFDDAKENFSKELTGAAEHIGSDRSNAFIERLKETGKDAMQSLALEQKINSGATASFTTGLLKLENVMLFIESYFKNIRFAYENMYNTLKSRHSEGGIEIQKHQGYPSPVLTDVAITIWDNLDKAGEIENGSSKDELSVYTVNRAKSMIVAANNLWFWFSNCDEYIALSVDDTMSIFNVVFTNVTALNNILGNPIWKYNSLYSRVELEYNDMVDCLLDMPLSEITYKESGTKISRSERFAINHKNRCIKEIHELLCSEATVDEISDKALELKAEERRFLLEENSFFVCRIGTGNMFAGEAPGALEVIPGEKPVANLDNIWGSGFNEIRQFISDSKEAENWSNLYLATSPSFTTDKANALLVGPPGCGKTQVFRSISNDPDSITIFAVGSDFFTAWSGESQKNPKRLFEAAVKLRKASGKTVYILIDEIDELLSNDRRNGTNINLTNEFQVLMDGVVNYPGIRLWGATNFPDRIPSAMIRRFSRVEVVGELDQEDRESTLRYYIENFLPVTDDIGEYYEIWARKLEGAVGDIIRKVADEVWKRSMSALIHNHPDTAKKASEFIRENFGDNFDVSEMNEEDRQVLKSIIAESYQVGPLLVTSALNGLLSNAAVRDQISHAATVYAQAKAIKKNM